MLFHRRQRTDRVRGLSGHAAPTVLVAHPSADLYGSDRVLLESVEGLVDAGARVVVAIPAEGPLAAELSARAAEVVISPTPVLRKSIMTPAGLVQLVWTTTRSVWRPLRLLQHVQPDVVYVNTLTIPLWPVLARLSGRRVVTHVHEAEDAASLLVKKALNMPLLFAHSILTNSQFSAAAMAKAFKRLHDKSEVILNGVPGPSVIVPLRSAITDQVRLVYLGRLSHRKGVDVAVAAMDVMNARGIRSRLDIVGAVFPGNEGFAADLVRFIKECGLSDRVFLHGFQREVWDFLAAADVAIIPSRYDEPFGNTAVEAILSARPAVVSDTSGLREAAGGYSSVQFVPPFDPEKIVDAVDRITSNWQRYREMALEDAKLAATKHNPSRYQQLLVRHLQRAMRGESHGANTYLVPTNNQGDST